MWNRKSSAERGAGVFTSPWFSQVPRHNNTADGVGDTNKGRVEGWGNASFVAAQLDEGQTQV